MCEKIYACNEIWENLAINYFEGVVCVLFHMIIVYDAIFFIATTHLLFRTTPLYITINHSDYTKNGKACQKNLFLGSMVTVVCPISFLTYLSFLFGVDFFLHSLLFVQDASFQDSFHFKKVSYLCIRKKIEEKKSKVAWNGKRVEECIAVHLSSLLTWCTAKGDTFFFKYNSL